jgi:hypothetical protein
MPLSRPVAHAGIRHLPPKPDRSSARTLAVPIVKVRAGWLMVQTSNELKSGRRTPPKSRAQFTPHPDQPCADVDLDDLQPNTEDPEYNPAIWVVATG